MVREEKTRRPFGTERRTETESAERYRVLRADAGTDVISQSGDDWILTQHIAVAQGPDVVGRDIRIVMEFEGDTFSTQSIRPDGTKQPFFVFRKLSDLGSSSLSGV